MWQGLLPPSNKSYPRKPATAFGKGKASCALNFSSSWSKGPGEKMRFCQLFIGMLTFSLLVWDKRGVRMIHGLARHTGMHVSGFHLPQ
jgi:hypothetical protein